MGEPPALIPQYIALPVPVASHFDTDAIVTALPDTSMEKLSPCIQLSVPSKSIVFNPADVFAPVSGLLVAVACFRWLALDDRSSHCETAPAPASVTPSVPST